jgi:hypothetical protein
VVDVNQFRNVHHIYDKSGQNWLSSIRTAALSLIGCGSLAGTVFEQNFIWTAKLMSWGKKLEILEHITYKKMLKT